jgi:hypothetical protein
LYRRQPTLKPVPETQTLKTNPWRDRNLKSWTSGRMINQGRGIKGVGTALAMNAGAKG